MTSKKAVSLIVLVITIIVMIILSGVIILSLDNSGIIDKAQNAVDETNLKEVQTLASLKWAEAFMDGNTTQEKLETEVLNRLNEEKIDLTPYEITVTDEGVKVELKGNTVTIPETWKANVIDIVDTVPIPKGFVASPYEGEKTKDGGLVIYELAPNEKAIPVSETEHTSKTTRNQYVWVPVEDFSKFVRQDWVESHASISNELGKGFWEVVLDTTNMPISTQSTSYMTSTTLAEVQAMYESVKEYKGFYIARYEAGLDVGSHKTEDDGEIIKSIHLKMNKAPYNYVRWTYNNKLNEDTNGAVEIARSIYPQTNANYGVVSTLTYGVQWDRTLMWWVETRAKTGVNETITSVTDSTTYGNHLDSEINTFNEGAKYTTDYSNYNNITTDKPSGTRWLLTTGATEEARVNNIYDMAGNIWEWTMEGREPNNPNYHTFHGGSFCNGGANSPVSKRSVSEPGNNYNFDVGFRPALYIKK